MKLLHQDNRGSIEGIAEKADVLRITSTAGSRRANHFHKRFGHWCVVIYGEIEYFERPVGSAEPPTKETYGMAELFYTAPSMEHLMVFPVDTEFYCFSTGARDGESYEEDTVRLDFQLDEQ